MTRNRAILAATSIAAAAALLVAGCGDDKPATPSPEPTPTSASPSASPSPSSTAVVVAPERPKEMDDDGPAGAEAAAVYFLELDDYIMKTGDTAEWEAMSHKSCEYCANRLDQAKELASNDLTWQGGKVAARVTHTYEQDAGTGIWPVDVKATISAVSVTDSSGDEVFADPRTNTKYRVEVARANNQWRIVGVADQPKS
ncbi:DUF6318 family protein [Krasilnikoviella flava]|uniref:DUF6318 domain-containing protein n=1 Tax=Krasilnikoviella flava TaxID=526729 RepID=A0A1T5KSC4_9MICO|nr:DUF6318 family protein [Krasilnikoviella flava]SKC66587.1 hypothetical protein SAMN04324258_2339 [Krasilnikoviella flava]